MERKFESETDTETNFSLKVTVNLQWRYFFIIAIPTKGRDTHWRYFVSFLKKGRDFEWARVKKGRGFNAHYLKRA